MSKEFDQIMKEIAKQNKEFHQLDAQISKEVIKDIFDLKKSVKNIETKIDSLTEASDRIFELLNTIVVFIEEAESINEEDLEDEEDWTPYDDRNFAYEDDDETEDDEWNSHEDES
jgi:hypothetical protein